MVSLANTKMGLTINRTLVNGSARFIYIVNINEFTELWAQTVQLASVLYKEGVDRASLMLETLIIWMVKKGCTDITSFRGQLSIAKLTSPSAWEQFLFMRHIAYAQ